MSSYVDVHTHLTDERFAHDWQDCVQRAKDAGLRAIVCNGLEPHSNRTILKMAAGDSVIKPALGIYPIDAVNGLLPKDFPLTVAPFDVDEELRFIRSCAEQGKLHAIGECGLDAHWIKDETYAEQERVFETLIDIAHTNSLPLIVHSRKREARTAEILAHHQIERVDFHCFGGKVHLALQGAEKYGWRYSIPANAGVNEAFQKMLAKLPLRSILTETDAPYLSPVKGERNEPKNVVGTVRLLAKIRAATEDEAKDLVWNNYLDLFQLDVDGATPRKS